MLSAVLFVLAVYVVVLVTPGPNLVVVTELAARGDEVGALFTGVGFGVGATILALATVSGLASLVLVAPAVKTVLTLVAAGVLIWFGISAWRSARREAPDATVERGTPGIAVGRRPAVAFFRGLAFNLTNPKALAFFVGVYGGPMTQAPTTVLVLVLVVCLAMEVVWYAGVTRLFSTARVRSLYARNRKLIGRSAGLCLVAFGAGVAAYAARPAEDLGM